MSFQTLDYNEMWTAIYALCLLGAIADFWSGRAHRSLHGTTKSGALWRRLSIVGSLAAIPILWVGTGLNLGSLIADTTVPR
ncbi:MAG: hypothetical protein R2706_01925 [Acidimicrobiales bacterium]